jgi:hypothetical protein
LNAGLGDLEHILFFQLAEQNLPLVRSIEQTLIRLTAMVAQSNACDSV